MTDNLDRVDTRTTPGVYRIGVKNATDLEYIITSTGDSEANITVFGGLSFEPDTPATLGRLVRSGEVSWDGILEKGTSMSFRTASHPYITTHPVASIQKMD